MEAENDSTSRLSVTLLADFDTGRQDSVAWSWVPAERRVREAMLWYPSLVPPQPESTVENNPRLLSDTIFVSNSYVQLDKKTDLSDMRKAAELVTYACNDFPRNATGAVGRFGMNMSTYRGSHALPVLVYTTIVTGDGEYTDVSAYRMRFRYIRAGFTGIGILPTDFAREYSMYAKQGRIRITFTSLRKVDGYTTPPVLTGPQPNHVQNYDFISERMDELWHDHVDNECHSPPQ